MPSTTRYYRITAAGIDKIEGPGEFTASKFHGIKIEATGQSIITLGKMSLVADIDTIQSQLAKPQPDRNIVEAAWESVKAAAVIEGCAGFVANVTRLIQAFL